MPFDFGAQRFWREQKAMTHFKGKDTVGIPLPTFKKGELAVMLVR